MPDNKNKLVNEAIEASIEFEELMDKTDFDSWLEDDNSDKLKTLGQEITPFKKFEENKRKLKIIYDRMKQNGANKSPKSEDKSSLEKNLIYNLFESKIKRHKARICSKKEDEEKEYNKALYNLLFALNILQNPEIDNNDKRWLILLYNDLSICYAGLENSSMSRGYAEEARRIIEEEESYKKFDQKFSTDNSTNMADIVNDKFVSSKFYVLYTITLFNQALAEKRSYLYSEAERNFKKIIRYAEEDTPLRNFNYYSALLNLSDLYMDQGRGKEAIEFLDKVINEENTEKENDIRYWNALLYKITALIDQSEYKDAENLLIDKFCKEESNFTLSERHKVTSTGFKGLNRFVRCIIENARNDLKRNDEKKEGELNQAKKIINDNIDIMDKRNQEGLETKAYRQLSDIYDILDEDEDVRKYLIKFISETEIDNLDAFISHRKMGNWIDKCDDLNALESLTDQIIKVMTDESIDKYRDLLEKIKEKSVKECEDKYQLSRAERSARKINEVLGKENDIIKYKKRIFDKSSRGEENGLAKEEIRTRLDINEKGFDSVLFERSKLKKDDHIVEVIVLRRWNSFSPGLFRESTGSLGGGYLLRINKTLLKKGNEEEVREDNKIAENKVQMSEESSDKKKDVEIENIVIDPGYNFLQNFRSEGFHVEDIDTIIVTHSHLDHCAELLPIMDLIYQFNKRYESTPNRERQRKRVNLCLSQGAYKKFSSYIDDPDWHKQLKDLIILENLDKKKWIPFEGLTISAIPTPHMDLGGVNTIGLIIEIDGIVGENEENSKTVRLGFTSDTPWYRKIREDFGECDLLCVHLGSIKYQEIGYTDDRYYLKGEKREIPEGKKEEKFKETYAKSNHLLFFGTEDIISHYDTTKEDSLIIVGEFGEELKYGLRVDLCKKLSMGKSIHCLPGDIGQYIVIEKDGTKKVRCNFCESFVRPNEIKTFSYGREDAIQYICQTCDKTLSELQKQAIIEHRVTRH